MALARPAAKCASPTLYSKLAIPRSLTNRPFYRISVRVSLTIGKPLPDRSDASAVIGLHVSA